MATKQDLISLITTLLVTLLTLPSCKLNDIFIKLTKIKEEIETPTEDDSSNDGVSQHEPEPLTEQQLASASPDQQKNMIGERLYPLINVVQPNLAGKITGMLLEMDNSDLLVLLNAPDALNSKIQEAIDVLAEARAKTLVKEVATSVLSSDGTDAAGNGDEEHKEQLSDAVATAAAASPAIVSGAALCSTDDGEEEHKESDAGADSDAEASGGTYTAAAALSSDGHEELKEHDDHDDHVEVTNKTWLLHCNFRRERNKLFEKVNGLIAERRKSQKDSREFRQLELQIGNVYKTIKGINDRIEETNPKCKCGEKVLFYNNEWNPLCKRCHKARKTSSGSKTVGRMATCGKRGNRLMALHRW